MTWIEVRKVVEKWFWTNIWRNQMEDTFLHDNFRLFLCTGCLTCVSSRRRVLEHFQKTAQSQKSLDNPVQDWDWCQKINVKSQLPKDPDWEDIMAAFQEACNDTSLTRKPRQWSISRSQSDRTKNGDSAIARSTRTIQETSKKRNTKPRYTCQSTDLTHDWKKCKGKKKAINELNISPEPEDKATAYIDYESSTSSK